MTEHVPPRGLVALMAAFLGAMSSAALGFWLAALVFPDGASGVIECLGPGVVSLFAALHVPAAITGVLLWQWRRARLAPPTRVALEAATLYFWAAVLIGLFFNVLAASLLDRLS